MRSADSILHEADYWLHVNQDVQALSDILGDLSERLAQIGTQAVMADLLEGTPAFTTIGGLAVGGMARIQEAQDKLLSILSLANGRATVLNNEADELAA